MPNEKLFGIDIREVKKQIEMNPFSCDMNSPINEGEFLEPCIRGAKKILEDEEKRMLMKKIYRR